MALLLSLTAILSNYHMPDMMLRVVIKLLFNFMMIISFSLCMDPMKYSFSLLSRGKL